MKNILVITGHTYANTSIANKKITSILKEKYPNAIFDDLAALYPDYKIDVEKEKEKLLWADTIIIQSPLFWYSMTSLINRWVEEVFEHGWAYGSKGHALDGKEIILGITAGAVNEEFSEGGEGVSVDEIIKPLRITFQFCRMNFLGTIFTGSILKTGHNSLEEKKQIEKLAEQHCENIIKLIDKHKSLEKD